MRHVASTTGSNLLALNEKITWPLWKKYKGGAHEAFRAAISEPEEVFAGIEIEPEVKKALLANIVRKLTPQPIKMRADIEVTCFNYEGIEAIRAALLAGEVNR
jgi:translation initiation factor 2 subunit 1